MLLGSLSEKSCDFGLCFGQSFLPLPCFLGCDSLCCLDVEIAWMLWKLGGIDGNPVLRGTRIRATWEYVSSVEGGQLGMVGLCVICGCGKICCAPSPDRHLVPHVMGTP